MSATCASVGTMNGRISRRSKRSIKRWFSASAAARKSAGERSPIKPRIVARSIGGAIDASWAVPEIARTW